VLTHQPSSSRGISTPLPSAVKMLELCCLFPGEVMADLGSGDGRIPILAASLFHASRAVGIEKDPDLAERSSSLVRTLGLDENVEIVCGDLLDADLSEFDAITLFQSQEASERLVPKLLRELRAGTRVVSYLLPLGSYSPLKLLKPSGVHHPFYLYVAPILPLDGDGALALLREIARHAEES
jgi:protein-L-isoaspartate O-methyltransferase